MSTDISGADGIGSRIEALLADLPGERQLAELPAQADLQQVARRLEAAHEVLVAALESVERG